MFGREIYKLLMTQASFLKNKNGVALIITFIFMVTLIVIACAYLFMATYDTRNVNAQINNEKALYLADAGLNKAVWYLLNTAPDGSSDGSWRTTAYPAAAGSNPTDPKQESLGDGTYTIWVETSGANVLVTSRGDVNGIQRTVQQEISLLSGWPAAFSYAIYGNDTSDTLELRNNVTINGHIYYDYSSGSVEVNDDASVSVPYYVYAHSVTGDGTYTQAPSAPNPVPSFPAFDKTSYDAAITTAESRASSNLTLSGSSNLNLAGATVYYKTVTIQNSATVTGPGTIVATKSVDIKNSANIGQNVSIITKTTMTLKNSAIVQQGGLLYARGNITLQDSANVTGSVITPENGKQVNMEDDTIVTGIIYGDEVKLRDNTTINGSVVADAYIGDNIQDYAVVNFNSSYLPSSIPEGFEADISSAEAVVDTWKEL